MQSLRHTLAGLAMLICVPYCAAQAPVAAPAPEARYLPMQMEAGVWDADITFFDAKGAVTGKAAGVQTNALLRNGHWVTNEFKVPATDKFPAFEGHGVWGFDPVAKTYVDTWVDTNDGAVRTGYGYWSESDKTMTWSAKQPNGQGLFVDYRYVVKFDGDVRTLTFYQIALKTTTAYKLAEMVFRKRKA
jgi:hypothetical protein